jgi:hypothetical protein
VRLFISCITDHDRHPFHRHSHRLSRNLVYRCFGKQALFLLCNHLCSRLAQRNHILRPSRTIFDGGECQHHLISPSRTSPSPNGFDVSNCFHVAQEKTSPPNPRKQSTISSSLKSLALTDPSPSRSFLAGLFDGRWCISVPNRSRPALLSPIYTITY